MLFFISFSSIFPNFCLFCSSIKFKLCYFFSICSCLKNMMSKGSEEPHGMIYTVNNVIPNNLSTSSLVSCLLAEGQMKTLYSGVPHISPDLTVWSCHTDRSLGFTAALFTHHEQLEHRQHRTLFSLTWYTGSGRLRFLPPGAQNQIAPFCCFFLHPMYLT